MSSLRRPSPAAAGQAAPSLTLQSRDRILHTQQRWVSLLQSGSSQHMLLAASNLSVPTPPSEFKSNGIKSCGGTPWDSHWAHSLTALGSSWVLKSPLRICSNARLFLGAFSSQSSASSSFEGELEEDNLWQRVQLLERLLSLAVAEEKYSDAKRIHDELIELKAQLPLTEQLVLAKVASLRNGSTGEKVEVITALGDMGDQKVLPFLFDGLRDHNPLVAVETEKAMWKIFMRSGREDVDRLLQDGVSLMVAKDFVSAREIFSEVIKMAPLFAEGWNKRATTNYLLQDFQASIDDCKQTLELNPYHFAALSGMGLCYIALRDLEAALAWFEKAYAMHPGLGQISRYIDALKQKLAESKDAEKKSDEDSVQ